MPITPHRRPPLVSRWHTHARVVSHAHHTSPSPRPRVTTSHPHARGESCPRELGGQVGRAGGALTSRFCSPGQIDAKINVEADVLVLFVQQISRAPYAICCVADWLALLLPKKIPYI